MVSTGDNGETTISTADWALVEIRRQYGSWLRFSPPVQPVRWPLRVGDTWSQTVTVEESGGKRSTVAFKFNVAGYESVTVPAGEFAAFKLIATAGGRKFSESWYSPETRTVVKTLSYNVQG